MVTEEEGRVCAKALTLPRDPDAGHGLTALPGAPGEALG